MDTPLSKVKTVDDVIDWIIKIGFPHYVKIVSENNIDGDKLRNISPEQLESFNVQTTDVSLIMKRLEQDLTKTESTESILQKKRKTDMQSSDRMQLIWMRRPDNLLQAGVQWKRKSVESENWRDNVGPMDLLRDSIHNPYPRIRVPARYNDKVVIVKLTKASENDSFVEFPNQNDYLRGNEARIVDGKADFEDLRFMQPSFVLNKWECWFLKFEIFDEPTEFIYSSPLKVRASSKQFLTTDASKVLKVSPLGAPIGRSVDVAIVGVFPRGPTFSIFFGKKEATFARGKNRIDSKITNGSCILVNIQEEIIGAVPVKIVTKEPRVMCNEDKTFVWTDQLGTSSPTERRSSESLRIESAGYESGGLFLSSFSSEGIDTEFDPLRGYSALHWACGQGKFKVVEYLIEKGADINLRDCEGATPLFWAAWTGNEQSIAYLLKKGAQPNIPNYMGFSPLHLAVYRGSTTLVQMLLYYKADPFQVNIFDEAPIAFATEYTVKRLLSAFETTQQQPTPSSPMTKLPPISSLQESPISARQDPNNNNPYNTSPQMQRRMNTETPVITPAMNSAPAPVPLNWYHYNTTPSQSDLSIILANKVIGDLNSLIQYLETTEPQLLMNSHLATAHYILNSFVSNLMSNQAKAPPPTTSPFAPSTPTSTSGMYNSPFVVQPTQAYKPTTTTGNISYTNTMPTSPFTPTPTAVVPTTPIYSGFGNTTATKVQSSYLPVSPVTPKATSTPVVNPASSSTYMPPIPMNLSMFKQPVIRPQQINLANVDFTHATLSDFEFLDVLGTGTFAKVQLCKHRVTKKHFCMKILNKAKIVKLKQVDHVSNEKNVLGKIAHPFIVRLYKTFKDRTNLYLLLEFIPGGELFNYIRKAGRLPNEIARIYAAEIILAFEYLHKQRIVYRDLKPENLLLDDYGHIKLTDFGFAKEVKERTFSVCGTPEYIAPEIILNKGHDVAVDWWSLGILIFEMLAGYPPFSEDLSSKQTVFEQILNQRVDIPDYFHPHARDIVQRLLVPDPSARVGFVKGMRDIKNHEWFIGIDWDKLYERRDCGPLNPEVVRDGDTHNFYKFSDVELQGELEDPSFNYEQIFLDF